MKYIMARIVAGVMKFLSMAILIGGVALYFNLGALPPSAVVSYFISLGFLAGVCASLGYGIDLLIDAQVSREQQLEFIGQQIDVAEQQNRLLMIIAKSTQPKK